MRKTVDELVKLFKKNQIEKIRFQVQKSDKYLKSKNDLKRPLGAFIKELWAIYVFFKSGQILKPCT